MRVLIVEDDEALAQSIESAVASGGMAAVIIGNGLHADQLLTQATKDRHPFDVVVLDLTLPGFDGLDVLRSMRRRHDATPVLILTARSALTDKVEGLESGADDYLVKPFEAIELVARLRAITRRRDGLAQGNVHFGALEFDAGRGMFLVNDAMLNLSAKAHIILEQLFRRRGKSVTKDFLANLDDEVSSLESIDTQISRLRKRLRDARAGVTIETLYGVGYMLTIERAPERP